MRLKCMWLFTTDGFFSAVLTGTARGALWFACAFRSDGERLHAALGGDELTETRGADYRFRISATHPQ